MQSNTTGHSMEIFLDIIHMILQIVMICMIYNMSKIVRNTDVHTEFFRRKFIQTLDDHGADFDRLEKQVNAIIELVKNDNERSLQAILERLDAAKPIKPNNWDSIKEAFKGPARVEINERN
jgi:hypothetical protein